MVNILIRIPDCDSHSPVHLDSFIFSDPSTCSTVALTSLGNSDHVIDSVSIDFPSNSKWDATFHRTAHDYSRADRDGLRYHFRSIL